MSGFIYNKYSEYCDRLEPQDAKSTSARVSDLKRRRIEAIKRPLQLGTSFTLTLTNAITTTREGRTLHKSLDNKCQIICELTTPLLTGYDGLDQISQVWRARVVQSSVSPGSEPDIYNDEGEGKLVLKIFQPSLGPAYGSDDYHPMEWVVRVEEESYVKAHKLQGSSIPYFFGCLKARLIQAPLDVSTQSLA